MNHTPLKGKHSIYVATVISYCFWLFRYIAYSCECHGTHGILGSPELTILLAEKQSTGDVQERGGSYGF